MNSKVIFLIILLYGIAKADEDTTKVVHNDQWIAYDKFLHFSVSASIVLSTQYTLEQKMNCKTADAMFISVLVSSVNGILKELWDNKQPNGFISKKDITANIAGVLLGIFIIKMHWNPITRSFSKPNIFWDNSPVNSINKMVYQM